MPLATFDLEKKSSAVLIEARSTVGVIEIATTEMSGQATVGMSGGDLDPSGATTAQFELPVESLHSGTPLYDAEVHRRLDAQRYPTIRAELRAAQPIADDRWAVSGDLTIHGSTRRLSGTAVATLISPGRIRVVGEQVVDIRDFDIVLPSALMLRIYPDVTVRYQIEAVLADRPESEGR